MSANTPSSPVIAVERRIVINSPLKLVFDVVADLRNDASWRKEINQTQLDAQAPGVGVTATEDAYLSARRPNSLTRLQYVAYEPHHLMRCVTPAGSTYWMRVERKFLDLGPAGTEFTYRLEFEQSVVREALGFAPPLWFLRWYSGWMMRQYMRQLKGLLEKAQTVVEAGAFSVIN